MCFIVCSSVLVLYEKSNCYATEWDSAWLPQITFVLDGLFVIRNHKIQIVYLLQAERIHRFVRTGRALRPHAQQIRSDFSIFQLGRCGVTWHWPNEPVEFRQLTVTHRRRQTDRTLFASTGRRNASLVHRNLAHFASIALMNASFQKFRAMPTNDGCVKCRQMEFVVGRPTTRRIQILPVPTNKFNNKFSIPSRKGHSFTHIASDSALHHLFRSASVFMYSVKAVCCVFRASNNWNLKRASRPSVRREKHVSTR